MKEKGFKGRVLFASRWSCFFIFFIRDFAVCVCRFYGRAGSRFASIGMSLGHRLGGYLPKESSFRQLLIVRYSYNTTIHVPDLPQHKNTSIRSYTKSRGNQPKFAHPPNIAQVIIYRKGKQEAFSFSTWMDLDKTSFKPLKIVCC